MITKRTKPGAPVKVVQPVYNNGKRISRIIRTGTLVKCCESRPWAIVHFDAGYTDFVSRDHVIRVRKHK
jgi:hypothetical protein